ncbi:MAG: alpha-1,4-glucan--maltose-1-phosphate maltosyltransferase [Nitrospinae bacterium CG11_big_fil_rev_8_21_14_0_20_56_8]|nr:MAG: alpha-1,4-glucan--maltose-1-phosphate maltosyltransferase [Nitrospinae bacterium CG11_big_fil_rev_8_21_14_0_20_56_8]
MGCYQYTVCAWVDHFGTWREELKRREDPKDIAAAALAGAQLLEESSRRAEKHDRERLLAWKKRLTQAANPEEIRNAALDPDLSGLMAHYPDRRHASCPDAPLRVLVDPEIARFSAWYELFPRSCTSHPGRHGTFKDCEAQLQRIADMGFNVVYFPPIHPIGRAIRKGRNNSLTPRPGDPGSPWAIGSDEGGHKAIHPDLGSLEDFRNLVGKARDLGLHIALDIAFQCSPDHPYVKEHPQWFRWHPDGTIQYAENPPKKYQDIYPFHFESEQWTELWEELKSVFLFWIGQGIHIFRVDNPHTKPFPFWEWVIGEIKREHPGAIFLSEAFTRPKLMHRLAKLGFSQSYTYFAWRNTKEELYQYLHELTKRDGREYFRPNLWPNTPDILNEFLQIGGRPAFQSRLVLAATACANYGIYGPPYETIEHRPLQQGSEEYLDSEKYQIRVWDYHCPGNLTDFISRVNWIRKENPALHRDWNLHFHSVDNPEMICYSKNTEDLKNVILVVVNLDPFHTQSGWLHLDCRVLGLDATGSYQAHDLLSDSRYLWHGSRNFVELNPGVCPAHIFLIRRRIHTEKDFEYYL